jgi:thiamine transport system permease protein
MAQRAEPLGLLATALVLGLTFGTLGAVAMRAEDVFRIGPADWAAIRFTVLQAALSALISVALAIPLARALARRQFPGRRLLVTLLGAPFILPVIVAVLGLLAVFGRNGIASMALGWIGLGPIQIYGLHGVVLAHVFFNMPLATRLILQGWTAIPAERSRLAASLGFSPRDRFRALELPMLRAVVPGATAVIFLICTSSFAVALALGGGPRATTIELAIYQAFRFDFDLARAAVLALMQFAIGLTAAGLAYRFTVPSGFGGGLDRQVQHWGISRVDLRILDAAVILLAAVFLLTPLVMIVLKGLPGLLSVPPGVLSAAGRSLLVALGSAALTLALALPMALLMQRSGRGLRGVVEVVGNLSIAASPLILGTGLFILIFPLADPVALALPVTAVVNALMALPFALRAIAPALRDIETDFGRLADSLGLHGVARMRLLILPRLRRPIGFAAGLAAALSMGDLGVVALFADPDHATLPLQLYRLMAAYRMQDAAAAALILLACSLLLFWIFDRGGRLDADA